MRTFSVAFAVAGLLVVSAVQVAGQESASTADLRGDWDFRTAQPAGLKSLMLIDPSRLSVTHSMSMSYGMGGAYGSGGSSVQGLFLNHVDYRLADPVHLWVDVGVGFQPGFAAEGESGARFVVPGFGLLYQPSDKFRFEVIVQNPSYYYNPYRNWRR